MLLLIAAVVAMLTRRLRLPYSVGLVVAGIILAAFPFAPKISLTKDLIFTALLPPLLFEAAFYLHWKELRRNFPVILVLATLGVVFSAGLTAAGMHFLMHWQWISALAFGALIAATDPVSVIATFKEAKAHGRLLVLIEAESLFNDGTAAVAFGVIVAVAAGQQFGSVQILVRLFETIGGGILCGAVVAIGALLLAGRTTDHLVEITFTTVAAYGSFLLADHFDFSGVLATITAGLVMSNFTWIDAISPHGKRPSTPFGSTPPSSLTLSCSSSSGCTRPIRTSSPSGFLPSSPLRSSLWDAQLPSIRVVFFFARSSLRVTAQQQHILFWGGLRGALALALALGLSPEIPLRETIIAISFAVVAFSVFVQSLTIAPLLRRMGEIPRS